MAIETIEREVAGLSENELQKVVEYIQFLKFSLATADNSKKDNKTVHRTPGGLEGSLIMAEDFDETPDCFLEYV